MTIVYRYNQNTGEYEGSQRLNICQITGKEMPIQHSTLTPPPEYSYGEFVFFENNAWVVKDIYVLGTFYSKETNKKTDRIRVKDIDFYTKTPNNKEKEEEKEESPPFITNLIDAKKQKILHLKTEGSKRIQTIDGRYYHDISWLRKSQNYQDIIARLLPKKYYSLITIEEDNLLKEAENVINRKDRYVQRINDVEAQIILMESIEQVNAINVTSDELWSGLDG